MRVEFNIYSHRQFSIFLRELVPALERFFAAQAEEEMAQWGQPRYVGPLDYSADAEPASAPEAPADAAPAEQTMAEILAETNKVLDQAEKVFAEKPRRRRRTKAEMEAARAMEAARVAEASAVQEPEAPTADPAPRRRRRVNGEAGPATEGAAPAEATSEAPVPVQELAKAASQAAQRLGSPAPVKEVLAQFGVEHVSSLKPEQTREFLGMVNAL